MRDRQSSEACHLPHVKWIKSWKTQLCWAACMEMVLRGQFMQAIRQCKMVEDAHGVNGCCGGSPGSECNQTLLIRRVAGEWDRYGIGALFLDGKISQEKLRREISACRAVELGFQRKGGGRHVVLVVDWEKRQGKPDVFEFLDPALGQGTATYARLRTANGTGKWKWTWTGITK